MADVQVYVGEDLGKYGFPNGHPFGPDRMHAFWEEARAQGLDQKVIVRDPVEAAAEAVERFHTTEYVKKVRRGSKHGLGLFDAGDTPAYIGCYPAAATVVGSTLDALAQIMDGKVQRAFVPIAGLHHARRGIAGGFCIFNDVGVVIETLRAQYGIQKVAYIDIDAHHGDGVFYEYEDDPNVFCADIHEDGRFLYPGTGFANETGQGAATGTKINLPLMPGSTDQAFHEAWPKVEEFLEKVKPEFVILQAGADSIKGDPVTHMEFTPDAHAYAARRLIEIANKYADGRILATGGGGYNRGNLGAAWTNVVREMLEAP